MTNKSFDSEKAFENWNDEMSQRYDPEAYHERSFILIRMIERLRVNAILDFLNSNKDHFVLEVGCGAGNVLERVNSRHRFGLDLSAFLLDKAKRRLKINSSLLKANAEYIPFSSDKFDGLVCTEVLEHVQNPAVVLSEMARVAKADAVIVVSIPNEKLIDTIKAVVKKLGLNLMFKAAKGNYAVPDKMTDEWHLHYFGIDLLRKIIPPYLKIEAIQPIPFALFPLRYVAKIKIVKKPA